MFDEHNSVPLFFLLFSKFLMLIVMLFSYGYVCAYSYAYGYA